MLIPMQGDLCKDVTPSNERERGQRGGVSSHHKFHRYNSYPSSGSGVHCKTFTSASKEFHLSLTFPASDPLFSLSDSLDPPRFFHPWRRKPRSRSLLFASARRGSLAVPLHHLASENNANHRMPLPFIPHLSPLISSLNCSLGQVCHHSLGQRARSMNFSLGQDRPLPTLPDSRTPRIHPGRRVRLF